SDGRPEAAPPSPRNKQHGDGNRSRVHGLHPVLPAGSKGRPPLGNKAAVSRPCHRSGRESRSRFQHQAGRYRHGYYDGVEREFRGFAYVEQRDAESVIGQFDLPPVVTKTWFHNGAYLKERKLEAYFKDPANQEFFSGDAQTRFLPDT